MNRLVIAVMLAFVLATPCFAQQVNENPSISFNGTLANQSEPQILQKIYDIVHYLGNVDKLSKGVISKISSKGKFDGTPASIQLTFKSGDKAALLTIYFTNDGKVYGDINTENFSQSIHPDIIKILVRIKVNFIPNLQVVDIRKTFWNGFDKFHFTLEAKAKTPPMPIPALFHTSQLSPQDEEAQISSFLVSRDEPGLKIIDAAKEFIAQYQPTKLTMVSTDVFSRESNFRGFDVYFKQEFYARFWFEMPSPDSLLMKTNIMFIEQDLDAVPALRALLKFIADKNLIDLANAKSDEVIHPLKGASQTGTPSQPFNLAQIPASETPTTANNTTTTPAAGTEAPATTPTTSGPDSESKPLPPYIQSNLIYIIIAVVVMVIVVVISLSRKK